VIGNGFVQNHSMVTIGMAAATATSAGASSAQAGTGDTSSNNWQKAVAATSCEQPSTPASTPSSGKTALHVGAFHTTRTPAFSPTAPLLTALQITEVDGVPFTI
jgi:hypothetical protein